jgi:8-oxo-dGTP pyrophosphatase MutT (NUDIX family)
MMQPSPDPRRIMLDDVHAAVRLADFDSPDAQDRMAPAPRGVLPENRGKPPREAGVLVLICEQENGLHVVLTRRTDTLRGHSGQVSFPGGRRDAADESFAATALRETCEELGICDGITVLGQLSSFYIPPSHFNVYPVVGACPGKPVFKPNPAEVAEVFTFALDDLLDERFRHVEYRKFQGVRIRVPYYDVNGHKVWGATAVMLSELEQRLRMVQK